MSKKEKICKWKAVCTWGDGPDVLLVHKKNNEYHNSYDLNIDEAKDLASDLLLAIKLAEEMNKSVEEYFNNEKVDKETLKKIKNM